MVAEVAPGVYLTNHEMAPGTSVAVTIVVGERAAIIDSGLATTPAEHILPALASIGLEPRRVAYIVNTHGHGDHVQGNAELVEATGAQVLVHEADVHLIEQPDSGPTIAGTGITPDDQASFDALPKPTRPPAPVGRALRDGDTIDLGRRTLRVIHTPGHAPGAILLSDDAAGLLVTGDSLQGRGTTGALGTYVPLIFDVAAYRQTLATVRNLERPQTVVTAHTFRPAASNLLDWPGWRELVLESAVAVDEVSAEVIATLQRQSGVARLSQVARALCGRFGYDGITTCSIYTARAFLEDLRRQGYLAGPETGGDERWRLR